MKKVTIGDLKKAIVAWNLDDNSEVICRDVTSDTGFSPFRLITIASSDFLKNSESKCGSLLCLEN